MLALAFSLVYCCAFGQPHRAASMAATLLALFSFCVTPIKSRGGDVSLYWSIRGKPFRGQGQPQCITTGLVGFTVLLMNTSAVGVHNWVKNSNKQAADHQMNYLIALISVDLTLNQICLTYPLSMSSHAHALLNPLRNSWDAAHSRHTVRRQLCSKRPPALDVALQSQSLSTSYASVNLAANRSLLKH